jgi:type VI secretion system protein ImpK
MAATLAQEPELAAPVLDVAGDPPASPRLLDGVLELMAYTSLFLAMEPARRPGFEPVAAHYDQLLRRAEEARIRDRHPEADWDAALFAVCAWIDERILCSDWPGRQAWLQAQLQRRRFHTTRGGELFFERLEALPADAAQVREVYDYCLSLGFQGCWFDAADQPRLAAARERNRALLAAPEPDGDELFPEAGRSAEPAPPRRRLRAGRLAYLALYLIPPVLFLLAYWSFSSILDGLLQKFRS